MGLVDFSPGGLYNAENQLIANSRVTTTRSGLRGDMLCPNLSSRERPACSRARHPQAARGRMAPNVPCCQKSGRDTELPSDLEEGDAVAALESALTYLAANADRFWKALGIHLELAAASLAVAAAVCIPLGIWAARSPAAGNWAMNVIEALRVVPSLAVLILVFPYLGFGARTAMVALSILASPPILVNTYVAYRNIDPAVLEAAVGMGMTPGQILRWIETPLAAPVVMAGIRTAASEVVASATLAAFIGGGGLGEFIVNGLAMNNVGLLLVGGIPVALLALLAEGLLSIPEYVVRRRIR